MNKYFFLLILASLIGYSLVAQQNKIDSLLNILKTSKADTLQVNVLNGLARQFLRKDSVKGFQYVEQALQVAEKIEYKKGIAETYSVIGNAYSMKNEYGNSIANYLKSLKVNEEVGDKKGIATVCSALGATYISIGNYSNALNYCLKSLKINEEYGNKIETANVYNTIGAIYYYQLNYLKALDNFLKSLKIEEEIKNNKGMAMAYGNIGSLYGMLHDFGKALEYNLKGLKINEELGNKEGIAWSYSNIGVSYEKLMNYPKALENHFRAFKMNRDLGDKEGMIHSYDNIGSIYMFQNKLEESSNYLNMSLNLSKEIDNKEGIRESYFSLSNLYEKKGNYKQDYVYHKLFSDIKDTLLNEQSSKQIAEMNTKYESEKKEKDIQILTKDKNLQQAEISKQKLIRNGTIGGLVLALLVAFVLFNRFKVISKQKKIIESQNFQIVESINYSKKIQNSLLPSIESMQKTIPSLFVFYEPKDIVSGDFYFFKEFENYILLACVDCTGHGVPGGFMSTLGSLLIDKITDNVLLKPSEILLKLSNEIVRLLHQQSGGEIQDGMDLSICLIDKENKTVEFSGARNGIIIVSGDIAKRYKADPLPVGGNYMKKGIAVERNFKTQTISVTATDWIYMYTDGFMEQVGGKEGVPMNYTQFENQLINVSKKQSGDEKNKLLQTELDNWRGIHERDDDVLIMGFQVV